MVARMCGTNGNSPIDRERRLSHRRVAWCRRGRRSHRCRRGRSGSSSWRWRRRRRRRHRNARWRRRSRRTPICPCPCAPALHKPAERLHERRRVREFLIIETVGGRVNVTNGTSCEFPRASGITGAIPEERRVVEGDRQSERVRRGEQIVGELLRVREVASRRGDFVGVVEEEGGGGDVGGGIGVARGEAGWVYRCRPSSALVRSGWWRKTWRGIRRRGRSGGRKRIRHIGSIGGHRRDWVPKWCLAVPSPAVVGRRRGRIVRRLLWRGRLFVRAGE